MKNNPEFLWVLRDFMLELIDERGVEMSEDQYLESCLEASSSDKFQVRRVLKKFFQSRWCKTLIRPSDDERDIQNLKHGGGGIKPEF